MIHETLFTVLRVGGGLYAMNTPRGILAARTLADLERQVRAAVYVPDGVTFTEPTCPWPPPMGSTCG